MRANGGEIDLIVEAPPPKRAVVFVEVKTRRSDQRKAEFVINPRKRRRMLSLAHRLARQRGWRDRPLRIDVIVIVWPAGGAGEVEPTIRHHPNAVTLND